MNYIKSVEEARERVKKGETLYLISATTRTRMSVGPSVAQAPVTASFTFSSEDDKPLWEIYYLIQEKKYPELEELRDHNGLVAITNIVKLT